MDALTPQTTPLLTAIINDATMPAALFRSCARLYAAAWRNSYRRTDPLDFDAELVPLLGVRRSQARQQLRDLRFAKLLGWSSDGQNRYVICFLGAAPGEQASAGKRDIPVPPASEAVKSEKADKRPGAAPEAVEAESGGGQDRRLVAPLEDDPYEKALRYLQVAGVWEDVAVRLAQRISENERCMQDGLHDYLPGVGDVLGWIAYCFADRKQNNIGHPAAVLAANLNANRRCPDEYLPPLVCATCFGEEDYCQCEDEEQASFHYPAKFLDYAFKSPYTAFVCSRWGVCDSCKCFPSQCHAKLSALCGPRKMIPAPSPAQETAAEDGG